MARPQAHLHSDGPLRRSVSKRTGHQRRGLHVADSLVEAAQADVRNLGGPELPQVRRRMAHLRCACGRRDYEVQRAALPTQGMDRRNSYTAFRSRSVMCEYTGHGMTCRSGEIMG